MRVYYFPVLLIMELDLRYYISYLHFKFEEDRNKLRLLSWTRGRAVM